MKGNTMDLYHTPSHTVTFDDTFTDLKTDTTYRAGYDEFAPDPRQDYWPSDVEHYVYNSAIRTTDDRAAEPEHPAIRAFLHYYDTDLVPRGTDPNEHAIVKARRYMAAFHPEWRGVIELTPGHGYSQGEWHDAVTVIDATDDWTPTTENAEAFGKEYTQWRYGDIYWVENVETGDTLHGIYADSMEDAVRFYIEGGY